MPGASESSCPGQGFLHRVEQSGLAERLDQARNRTALQGTAEGLVVGMCGDEDDGNVIVEAHQLTLKIWSRHSWHRNIENDAIDGVNHAGVKKRLRRRIGMSFQSE